MRSITLLILWMASFNVWAADPLPQGPTPQMLQEISQMNQTQAELDQYSGALENFRSASILPFAEYQDTGYIFFNDDEFRGYATAIKSTIAKNLPQEVTLVVYTTSTNASYVRSIKEKYEAFIAPERLIVLKVPRSGSNNFWTRDNLPLPVWTGDDLTLVDARYYYNFEPDAFLTELFQALSQKHNYFFEGGNFITNARGECIVVNRRRSYPGGTSDTGAIPDSVFTNQYGCKKLTRLRHLKGIGHADEVVKFMTDDIIVTDTHEYVEKLESIGYTVVMLPEPDLNYETYVNSLQVNDTLFVPSFGETGDQRAVEIFESLGLGLKIVTAPTRQLATRGQGGIHCITMNYPPVPLGDIVRSMNATLVE